MTCTFSCITQKQCMKKYPLNESNREVDSIYTDHRTRETQRDSIYIYEGFAYRELPVEKDVSVSLDTAFCETTLAYGFAYLFDGYIRLNLYNKDSAKVPILYMYIAKKTEKNDSVIASREKSMVATKIKHINALNTFQSFCFYSGLFAWIILLLCVILKLLRRIYFKR